MKHSQSLLSPTQALLRVFCSRAPTSTVQSLSHRKAPIPKYRNTFQLRNVFTMRRSNFANTDSPRQVKIDPFPDVIRDHGIKARYVRIPTPGGGLSPPESLRLAMSRIRRDAEHLVQISKMDEDETVICRIMTVAELLQQKRDKARVMKDQKKSLKQSAPKQIELNWAIGRNDLEHKLAQLQGFLEEGRKVEIVLAGRKKQRQATPEEGSEVLKKVLAKIEDADAREISPMKGGQVGRHTVLSVGKKGSEGIPRPF